MATPSTPDPKDVQRLEELYKKIQGYTEAGAQAAAQLAISNGKAADELTRLEVAYKDLMKDVNTSVTSFTKVLSDANHPKQGSSNPSSLSSNACSYGTKSFISLLLFELF